MNFRVTNEKGMISNQMKDAKEVARAVMREAIAMKDDDIILLYLNDDDTMRLGKNVISIHLKDNILEVYNENCEVICFYDHYDTVRAIDFFNTIKAEVEKLITEYETFVFEQAEDELTKDDFTYKIGNNTFRFKGRDAKDCIYNCLYAVFESLSHGIDSIVITDMNKGTSLKIEYVKGLTIATVTVNGETGEFVYCRKNEREKLHEFIKKAVIL